MSVASELREFALSLPDTHEDFPWGERVVKVGQKVFLFLGHDDDAKVAADPAKRKHIGEPGEFRMSLKLPESGGDALSRSFASPTEYGLGAKGWVSMSFRPGETPPLDDLKAWIKESYRAVALKKLVKRLEES